LLDRDNIWPAACLLIPILIYGTGAVRSNLNLGIRHLIPILPFVFILLGLGAAALRRARRRTFNLVVLVVAIGLAVETTQAFPDFISFFNRAAGGIGRNHLSLSLSAGHL